MGSSYRNPNIERFRPGKPVSPKTCQDWPVVLSSSGSEQRKSVLIPTFLRVNLRSVVGELLRGHPFWVCRVSRVCLSRRKGGNTRIRRLRLRVVLPRKA